MFPKNSQLDGARFTLCLARTASNTENVSDKASSLYLILLLTNISPVLDIKEAYFTH